MSRSKLFSKNSKRTGNRSHGCRCSCICLPTAESNRYFHLLERHPYLCSLFVCLLLNALYFGGEAYLAQNAVLLETLALLAAGAAVLWRLVRYQPQKKPTAVCVSVVYTLLVLAGAWCYHEARHSGLWVLVGGCAVLSGLFWLTRKQYHNQRRRVLSMDCDFDRFPGSGPPLCAEVSAPQ